MFGVCEFVSRGIVSLRLMVLLDWWVSEVCVLVVRIWMLVGCLLISWLSAFFVGCWT